MRRLPTDARRRGVLAIVIAAALAATLGLAHPAPARGQAVDLSCQLALTRLDATTSNALALDTNAVYWATAYAAVPGTRLRIEGRFPYSRFIGFNLYDALGRPLEALADHEIRPDRGAVNPYRAGAPRFTRRRGYTLFVELGPAPANPPPNTLYTGDSPVGTLWYRVYIPDRGRDAKGGTPLPRVTLEPASGDGQASAFGNLELCGELGLPYVPDTLTLVEQAPAVPVLTGRAYPGRNPPNWRLFVNFGRSAADILLDNESGEGFHEQATAAQSESAGYFSSANISYVFAPTSRGFGELLVVRGRAPGFADTRAGPRRMPRRGQTRYWSFCQYEPATQRVIACRSDDRIAVDRHRRYRIVVGHAGQRPANAVPRCGITWLPWGPATQGLLIYRQMLAKPSWMRATARIPHPGEERRVMRGYYPRGSYVADRAAFEARGCERGHRGT